MKKKFFAVVAAVVAFVMCFALIACGNPDAPDTPGNKTSEKEGMAKQAATAVTAVLDKEGVSGNLGIKLTATGEKAIELSGAFEKSGNRVKVVSGDEEMLLDLTTGYMYTLENGAVVYCEGVMPTGLYDYVVNMVEKYSDSAQMSPEVWAELDDLITYDTATKTVSYKLDLAEQINGLTEALYEGYKGNKSLTWLLDEYLLYFTGNIQFSPIATGQTGTSIVDMISGFALTFPDKFRRY